MAEYGARTVGIIGAGPAGMMAAIYAAQNGAQVTLFEKNSYLGKKLGITGKGRCNVTNDCDGAEFLKNVIANPKFLYAAINNFSTADTKAFFESMGVELKTERGRRVFPVSDKASDIVNALRRAVSDNGVNIAYEKVLSVTAENGCVKGLKTDKREYSFDAVIVATGGASYPGTGSDGDGYRFAQELGIEVTDIFPSLVPLETTEDVSELMGLSLKNVTLKIRDNNSGKTVFSELGEMMFTHFGLTGPVVLSASAHMREIGNARYSAHIDLKPALDEKALDARLLSDFAKFANKDFCNALDDLLPQKMIPVFLEKSRIDPRKKVNIISKDERKRLLNLFKDFSVSIHSFRPIDEAIITSGGVSVKEIDPRTMACKKIGRLYLAGEMIDVDGYTGGFNLQIAFSTAYAAAKAVSESVHE